MRAESFYNFATYIEQVSDLRAYGGKSLHEQSHGDRVTRDFLNAPERYFKHLFRAESDEESEGQDE